MFGENAIGKELALRFINEGNDFYLEENEDEYDKLVEFKNHFYELKIIYNSNEQETNVDGTIFVFDISNLHSFENLKDSINTVSHFSDHQFIIAGIHSELRHEKSRNDLIPYERYEQLGDEFNTNIIEISFETGENINEVFYHLISKIINGKNFLFNIGVFTNYLGIKGYTPPLNSEFSTFVNVDEQKIKLRISDPGGEMNFTIFRKDTVGFVYVIDIECEDKVDDFIQNITYLKSFYGNDIVIVIVAINSEKLKKKQFKLLCEGMKSRFGSCKIVQPKEEEYMNEILKYIAKKCLNKQMKNQKQKEKKTKVKNKKNQKVKRKK